MPSRGIYGLVPCREMEANDHHVVGRLNVFLIAGSPVFADTADVVFRTFIANLEYIGITFYWERILRYSLGSPEQEASFFLLPEVMLMLSKLHIG